MKKSQEKLLKKVFLKHIKGGEQNNIALFSSFLCLYHPSDGRIVIFIEEYENLFLKHSSCPAIFSTSVFEILQKDFNRKLAIVLFSKNQRRVSEQTV